MQTMHALLASLDVVLHLTDRSKVLRQKKKGDEDSSFGNALATPREKQCEVLSCESP